MAVNFNLKKDIELGLREYWEIVYKRRFFLTVTFLSVFIVTTLLVIFAVRVKYCAKATVVIAPPSITIGQARGIVVREMYDITTEMETMQGDIIVGKTSEFLKNNSEYNLDISPGEIKTMLYISNRLRTQIIDISTTSTDPREAFFVLKTLITVYVENGKERRMKAIKDLYEALSSQLGEKRKEVEVAENALTKFLLNNEIIASAIEVGTSEIEAGEKEKESLGKEPRINDKYLMLKSQRIDKENFLNEVHDYKKKDELAALSVIAKREPNLVDLTLRDTLYEKERALAKLMVTQSEIHPNVVEARGEVDEAKKKVTVEVDRAVQSLEINVKTLREEEEKLRKIIDVGLSDKMLEYSTLRRELDTKKGTYTSFLNELQQISVTEKFQSIPFLRVIKAPILPTKPVISKPAYIFFAFLFSLILACFSVFIVENINVSIESIEEVEDVLGLSVLASIPLWKKRLASSDYEEQAKQDLGLVTVRHPKSAITEAFRTLRANISFLAADKKIKSIIITSTSPKEGKSFIASNLAAVLASSGQRVVLVDADLRKPTIHKYFNMENIKGLSNFLIGEDSLLEVRAYDTDIRNLRVIPSGPIPSNPNELLGAKRMDELLARLNGESDIVIIDSPPVLAVSDSLILSAKAEGTILVIFANSTTRNSGARANILLRNAGAKMLGGVLNGAETAQGGYYYSQEYHSNES